MRELIKRIAELICEPDYHRELVRRPFEVDGDETIVTDSRILVSFDGRFGYDIPDSATERDVKGMVNAAKVGKVTLKDFSLIPPTIEKPTDCNDRWEIEGPDEVECEECGGSGEVTCEYDHHHECPDCDGSGMIDNTEPTWHERKDERIDIGGHDYAAFYVWILNQLPNVRCAVHADETNPLEFVFDGGHGKLCAIMKE